MTRRVAVLVAVAALPPASAAAVQKFPYALLAPTQPVAGPPPLPPGKSDIQTQVELRLPAHGHVDSRELVTVGIGPDGAPVRVLATQRLEIHGTGDYSFVVPASATRVVPGPGTQSQPGLRDVGLIWQGFSSRERILSATATLETAAAAPALPLQVEVERQGAASVVRLRNVTQRDVATTAFSTTRAELLGALAKMRGACRPARMAGGPWYVEGANGHGAKATVSAPLHVTGTVGGRAVDVVLGGHGRAHERTISVPAGGASPAGGAAPAIRLRAEPLAPCAMLPSGAALAASPDPLATLQSALAEMATSWAYRRFLDIPDPQGAAEMAYVYRSAPKPARATATARPADGGDDTLAIVLGTLLGVALLAGLATLWARS